MGVDCKITLPGDCRVSRVADVIGILVGHEKRWEQNGRWVEVGEHGSVQVESAGVPGLARIRVAPTPLTWQEGLSVFYHFEWSGAEPGARGMMPRSYGLWIAIAKRLVEFFGGQVDFNDCDDVEVNYRRPHPPWRNDPEDGDEWFAMQQRLWNLQPLTRKEIEDARRFAAYPEYDETEDDEA